MGEIFIFFEARAVGGSVTDHPGLYLCQKQSKFSGGWNSYLIRNLKLKEKKNQEMEKIRKIHSVGSPSGGVFKKSNQLTAFESDTNLWSINKGSDQAKY